MAVSMDKGGIFFNTEADERRLRELIVPYHALGRIMSGETQIEYMGKRFNFGAGSTILAPRNQLARMTKLPKDGEPYRSVSIFFPEYFLRRYYESHKLVQTTQRPVDVILFEGHLLLDSLFTSLLPYFHLPGELPEAVISLKMEEAVTIMRIINPQTDIMLGNFDSPGKIPLMDYMEKNYMYNLPMERFGYLTGRSLTTFKRDFRNTFHTTFQQWITRKRLELAHHQIFAMQRKPNDVYMDVGFENLSHFSFAFKKHFGYNPTSTNLK